MKLSVSWVSKAGRPPFCVKLICTVAVPVLPAGFGSKLVMCLSRPVKLGSTTRSNTVSLAARAVPLTISRALTASCAPAATAASLLTRTLNSRETPSRSASSPLPLVTLPRLKVMVWLPSGLVTTTTRLGSKIPAGAAPERSGVIGRASGLSSLPLTLRVPPTMRLASLTRPPLEMKAIRKALARASGEMNSRPLARVIWI
ncbi:hypothetical protein D3C84_269200 [compost metagenome]